MKTDFLKVMPILLTAALTVACGSSSDPSSVVEKTSVECEGEMVAGRWVVKNLDGSTVVVNAKSKTEFLELYVKKNLNTIEYAEPDFYVSAGGGDGRVEAKAPMFVSQPDNWGAQKINADKVWQQNVRGDAVTVAVIDSGVDINHSQLKDQIATNPGEIGTDSAGNDKATNSLDDDGNGFIDDAYGFDFTIDRGLTGDNTYHGTHVAGIIAAKHSDTAAGQKSYVQGVAPHAKIMALAFLDSSGSGVMSDGVRAIKYAVTRGARVLNASWGGPMCSRSLRDTVADLKNKNVAFVAAAGNESSNVDRFKEYPASLNLAAQITVGATGSGDSMASYSNYGSLAVHIFAPGTAVVSTIPGDLSHPFNNQGSLSGTSMATPFVAGAVAVLMSAVPQASVEQIRRALYNTASKSTEYLNASQGRLDLNHAVQELHTITGL